jgi:hypothetical protein
MFVKITKSGPRRYVQLVQALRNEEGQPRQRTIATLGRLDRLDSRLETVLNGLLRATGRGELKGKRPNWSVIPILVESAQTEVF